MDTSLVVLNTGYRNSSSFAFFMGLDPLRKGKVNRQIVECWYPSAASILIDTLEALKAKGGRGVVGINSLKMISSPSILEKIADAFKSEGWWGTGPLPDPGFGVPHCETHVREESNIKPMASHILMSILNGPAGCAMKYVLPHRARVDLRMVDAQGRMVRKLVGREQAKGTHRVNVSAQKVPAGVYFFDLRINGEMGKRARHAVM